MLGLGNLLTSLSTPVLAQRMTDQRVLVVPVVVVTAGGLAGALWAPLGSAVFWMLVLGAAQGAALGLAIFFTMARAPDPATAASLSSLAQSVGYLLAAAGPLAVGFLRAATGGGRYRSLCCCSSAAWSWPSACSRAGRRYCPRTGTPRPWRPVRRTRNR